MDFDFIIKCGECPFFSWRCDYPYRKMIDFLYVQYYPFRKLIIMLYNFWHGHPIIGALLAMLQFCDYPIPENLVNFHCGYLVSRKWPTFVSTRYTGLVRSRWSIPEKYCSVVYLMTWSPNTWSFSGHVAILQLSHTWKSCWLSLRLSRKEKLTEFRINPIHGASKYMVVVVTYLTSFTWHAPDTLSILNK